MLCYVCALLSEAKPLISYFKLKHDPHFSSLFPIYRNENSLLIISGVGKISAAAAVSFLYHLAQKQSVQVWLNIGVGGHKTETIGKGFIAHKITDQGNNKSYYPTLFPSLNLPTAPLHTVEKPELTYPQPVIYDMEAAGFFATASRLSTIELIHCYKIISDNQTEPTHLINGKFVEQLIEAKLDEISHLSSAVKELIIPEQPPKELPLFLNRWHFTTTQTHKLTDLLRRLKAINPTLSALSTVKADLKDAKTVLKFLKIQIDSLPLSYL